MNCDCISKIEIEFQKAGYDAFSFDNLIFTINGDIKKGDLNKMRIALNIPGSYKKKNKDGEYKKKGKILNIEATFCPFCGKATK